MPTLGVNIDHVATVREARKTTEPDPVWAAAMAELGGADQITIHLRQDRRHIQDRDVEVLKKTVNVRLNLECGCVDEMLDISCRVKPDQVCLVPESRQEITTEGGLDVIGNRIVVQESIKRLQGSGIKVSLFIDPSIEQIEMAAKLGADAVEIHTGGYANAKLGTARDLELTKLQESSRVVIERGIELHAGHGLTYTNVLPVAHIEDMLELNIGHSIISRALFIGLQAAVREMKNLIA